MIKYIIPLFLIFFASAVYADSNTATDVFLVEEVQGDSLEGALKSVPIFGKVLGEVESGRTLTIIKSDNSYRIYYRGKIFEFTDSKETFNFSIENIDYKFNRITRNFEKSSKNTKTRKLYLRSLYKTENSKQLLNSLKEQIKDLEEEKTALSQKLNEINNYNSELIIDISSSEKIIEILQNKNIQLSLYQSGDVSDLMNSIKDKELEIEELEIENQGLKSQINSVKKGTSPQELKNANELVVSQQTEIIELKTQIGALQETIVGLEENIKKLNQELDILEAQNSNLVKNNFKSDKKGINSETKRESAEELEDQGQITDVKYHLSNEIDDLTGKRVMVIMYIGEKLNLGFRCNYEGKIIYEKDWIISINGNLNFFDDEFYSQYRFSGENLQEEFLGISGNKRAYFIPDGDVSKFTKSARKNSKFTFSHNLFTGEAVRETFEIEDFRIGADSKEFCPCITPENDICP